MEKSDVRFSDIGGCESCLKVVTSSSFISYLHTYIHTHNSYIPQMEQHEPER